MSSERLVSAVIPFLNAGKYIGEAIDSVLAQTYAHWELLLVDDGSSDGSTDIARRYADQYPAKIRYLKHDNHKNRGMAASRNLGIRNAMGEYIAFLDADDIWLPRKLDEQVRILLAYPQAAMMYGRTLRWYSWMGNPRDTERDYMNDLGVPLDTLVSPPTLVNVFLRNEDTVVSTCSVLIRREVIKRVGGFEEDFRDMYEDMVFYAKVFLREPVFVASGCWGWYRQHPENSCSVAVKTGRWHPVKPNPTRRTFLNWLATYMTEQGFKDPKVWKGLRRELLPYHHRVLSLPLTLARYVRWRMIGLVNLASRSLPVSVRRWARALRED